MSVPVEFRIDPAIDDDELRAVKALARGEASPSQQMLVLRLVCNKLSRSHDILYVPGDDRAGAFLNGRAFVGMQILKALKLPIGKLPTTETTNA